MIRLHIKMHTHTCTPHAVALAISINVIRVDFNPANLDHMCDELDLIWNMFGFKRIAKAIYTMNYDFVIYAKCVHRS